MRNAKKSHEHKKKNRFVILQKLSRKPKIKAIQMKCISLPKLFLLLPELSMIVKIFLKNLLIHLALHPCFAFLPSLPRLLKDNGKVLVDKVGMESTQTKIYPYRNCN